MPCKHRAGISQAPEMWDQVEASCGNGKEMVGPTSLVGKSEFPLMLGVWEAVATAF